MQINSIGSTSFGLKIDSDMQELLDKSREAAKSKGKEEYDSFVKAEEKMKTMVDDKYELYLGTYGRDSQEVNLETPRHGIWQILKIEGSKKVLTANDITENIMYVIKRAKTSERERYLI